MKFTLLSLLALGAFAMAVGPADRAAAGEPMVLTDAQLDRVTAGQGLVEYALILVFSDSGKEVTVRFTADNLAGENDGFLGGFDPVPGGGGTYVKTVPYKGFGFIEPGRP